jgi:hypothetical protein
MLSEVAWESWAGKERTPIKGALGLSPKEDSLHLTGKGAGGSGAVLTWGPCEASGLVRTVVGAGWA